MTRNKICILIGGAILHVLLLLLAILTSSSSSSSSSSSAFVSAQILINNQTIMLTKRFLNCSINENIFNSSVALIFPNNGAQYPCPSITLRNMHVGLIQFPDFFAFSFIILENLIVESFLRMDIAIFNPSAAARVVLRNVTVLGRNLPDEGPMSDSLFSTFFFNHHLFQNEDRLRARDANSANPDPNIVKMTDTSLDHVRFLRNNFIETFEIINCTFYESPASFEDSVYHASIDIRNIKLAKKLIIQNTIANSTFQNVKIQGAIALPTAELIVDRNDFNVNLPSAKRPRNPQNNRTIITTPQNMYLLALNYGLDQQLLAFFCSNTQDLSKRLTDVKQFSNRVLISNNNLRLVAVGRRYTSALIFALSNFGQQLGLGGGGNTAASTTLTSNSNDDALIISTSSISLINNDIRVGTDEDLYSSTASSNQSLDALNFFQLHNFGRISILFNKAVLFSQGALILNSFTNVTNGSSGILVRGNVVEQRSEGFFAVSCFFFLGNIDGIKNVKKIELSDNNVAMTLIITDRNTPADLSQTNPLMFFHVSRLDEVLELEAHSNTVLQIGSASDQRMSIVAFIGILDGAFLKGMRKIFVHNNSVTASGELETALFCSVDARRIGPDESMSELYSQTNLTVSKNSWDLSDFILIEAVAVKAFARNEFFSFLPGYFQAVRFTTQVIALVLNDNSALSYNLITDNKMLFQLPTQSTIDCTIAIVFFAGSYTSTSDGDVWPRYNKNFQLVAQRNSMKVSPPTEFSGAKTPDGKDFITHSKSFFASSMINLLGFASIVDQKAQQKSLLISDNEIFSEYGGLVNFFGTFGGLNPTESIIVRNNRVFVRSVGNDSLTSSLAFSTRIVNAVDANENVPLPIVVYNFKPNVKRSAFIAVVADSVGSSFGSKGLVVENNTVKLVNVVGVTALFLAQFCGDEIDSVSRLPRKCFSSRSNNNNNNNKNLIFITGNTLSVSGALYPTSSASLVPLEITATLTPFHAVAGIVGGMDASVGGIATFVISNNFLTVSSDGQNETKLEQEQTMPARCAGLVFYRQTSSGANNNDNNDNNMIQTVSFSNNVINFTNCNSTASLVEVTSWNSFPNQPVDVFGNVLYIHSHSRRGNYSETLKNVSSSSLLLVSAPLNSNIPRTTTMTPTTTTSSNAKMFLRDNKITTSSASSSSFEESAFLTIDSSSLLNTGGFAGEIRITNNNFSFITSGQLWNSTQQKEGIRILGTISQQQQQPTHAITNLVASCNFYRFSNGSQEEADFIVVHDDNASENLRFGMNISEMRCIPRRKSFNASDTNATTNATSSSSTDNKFSPAISTTNNGLGGFSLVASTIAASIVPSAGFGVSRNQAMINFIQNIRNGDCSGIAEPDAIPPADSPTQLSIGSSDARFYIGGAVGNFVLTLGLILLAQLGGTLYLKHTNSSSWHRPFSVFARCHVAMMLFICMSLLFAPTIKFGLVVAALPDLNIGERVLAIIFSVLYTIATFYYAYWSLLGRERKEAYRLFLQQQNKSEKKNDQNSKSKRDGKSSNKSLLTRVVDFWFQGPGEWQMPRMKSKHGKNVTEQDNLAFDAAAPIIDGYQARAFWFGGAEFLVQVGLALSEFIAQLVPQNKSCVASAVVLLVVLSIYLLLCLWLRPFQELFNRVAMPAITFFQILIIALAFYYEENPPDFIVQMAIAAMSLQSVVVLIVLVASLSPLAKSFLKIYRRLKKSRSTGKQSSSSLFSQITNLSSLMLGDDKRRSKNDDNIELKTSRTTSLSRHPKEQERQHHHQRQNQRKPELLNTSREKRGHRSRDDDDYERPRRNDNSRKEADHRRRTNSSHSREQRPNQKPSSRAERDSYSSRDQPSSSSRARNDKSRDPARPSQSSPKRTATRHHFAEL